MPASGSLAFYLIFHLSTRCNLECSYCNVNAGARGPRPLLSLEAFEKWLEAFACLEPAEIAIQLHGGEPLILNPPVELYAAVAANALARHPRTKLTDVAVQSNGLMLDEDRLASLSEAGVRVNISIDGPAAIHDRQRPTAAGGGSHRAALRAHRLLRAQGNNNAVLAVVSDPGEVVPVLEFFLREGFREARMNPMRPEGRGAHARDWNDAAFMREMAREYARAARLISEHNRTSPDKPFIEDNLAGVMQSLLPGEFPAARADSFHWTFMIDDRGALWAHPGAYGIEALRLSDGAKIDSAALREALSLHAGPGHSGGAAIPDLRALRSRLFAVCKDCPSPEFCIAYQGPNRLAESPNPVCVWRTELTQHLEAWLHEAPEAARRVMRPQTHEPNN
jgi:MoaA/NifB/PqqE/SkfB family radical SAM enzyme